MERISGREVYRNAWMSVREDRVRRADGGEGVYGVVDKPDFALVVPYQGDGEGVAVDGVAGEGFWMVEQFRYPVGRRAWEFPQGTSTTGAEAEALARDELEEETGLRAGSLHRIGFLYAAYGMSSQGCSVWLATDLVAGRPRREETEADMVSGFVPRGRVRDLVAAGGIADGPSLAALWMAEAHLP
ncbi:NUDIX domain-containing protein [Kineococcus gynurae]|uniref:NUDIX domain-containing protein n=1 Tax=Kineococcus gynurae TaxID=452979 RepID=A0ABV5LMT7_9ACTN